MNIHSSILTYRSGQCRNDNNARSHTYAETAEGLFPMCRYGWNRSNGHAFSIFRGAPGSIGECLICRKNLKSGKGPVFNVFEHKTKWI